MKRAGRHTRRQVLKAAAGAAGMALGWPARAVMAGPAQAPAGTDVVRLGDDLFILSLPGEANVVAYTSAGGVLVDGGSAAASDALLSAVAALPGAGPIRTLINTHWHREQTGLNERLGTAGATIIAHENTRLWLATDVTWPWSGQRFTRLPKVAQPNKTIYTTGELESDIRYGHVPDASHTDGDLYVYFARHNVLAVGDVLSGQGWPIVDWATGGWIGGIVGGLERVKALADADTRIVPGRGPVLRPVDLQTQSEMYGTIYQRLTQLLNRGSSPAEAVAARPAMEFEARMGNSDEFVRRAFESLWAYLSPDA